MRIRININEENLTYNISDSQYEYVKNRLKHNDVKFIILDNIWEIRNTHVTREVESVMIRLSEINVIVVVESGVKPC